MANFVAKMLRHYALVLLSLAASGEATQTGSFYLCHFDQGNQGRYGTDSCMLLAPSVLQGSASALDKIVISCLKFYKIKFNTMYNINI